MRKSLFVSGLLLIIIGLTLSSRYDISVFVESYVLRNSVVNTYVPGSTLEKSVSAYFEAGERLFFNFSVGLYWGGTGESFEPAYVGKDFSIDQFKTVSFEIYTPSGDACEFQAWVVSGLNPYVIIFINESEDFTPLPNGNLTFSNIGVEGIVNKSGTYNFTAICIDPAVLREYDEPLLTINEDPPREMNLYVIENLESKPYYLLLHAGIFLAIFGVAITIWGVAASKKRKRRLRNRYRKLR